MDKEHFEEWGRLRDSTLNILRAGICKHGIRLLHLLAIPTFGPSISYEINKSQKRHEPPSYYLTSTLWRYDIDVAKFDSPIERLRHPQSLPPTLEIQSFEVADEFVNCTIDKFKAISIPMLINTNALGLDGTSYEIGLGEGLIWSRFHWWGNPPSEWQQLGAVFHDTLLSLERVRTGVE